MSTRSEGSYSTSSVSSESATGDTAGGEGQDSVCWTNVGVTPLTYDAEALHEYVSSRTGLGSVDGNLQDRWLCIPGGTVHEIAPIYVLNRARGVDLSMGTILVPGSDSTHVIRLTPYNHEETKKVLRTTGILCLTDNVESLQVGEKITTFGRYKKSHFTSGIQLQVVRWCKWER